MREQGFSELVRSIRQAGRIKGGRKNRGASSSIPRQM
uniref:Uncharacterized protein n=1 Tax=Candidatus Kentrum sp. TC TaxID=2126339 RepID=A0A450ZM51_9GAMM|nr:MAG: hypothetical protein BECKTC1821E_GA0114239_100410 [Candidatus Kentron sp. TC]VFK49376.1 MAG: hypothetical protein BECKTC1821D_GA0114238_10768 [Candidatus Kentron sp. TC]VFK54903.1 MAG: hypothetical protein BECKTC1821F_GA0114240_10062 [Candidatus Kentron sp. TC]